MEGFCLNLVVKYYLVCLAGSGFDLDYCGKIETEFKPIWSLSECDMSYPNTLDDMISYENRNCVDKF